MASTNISFGQSADSRNSSRVLKPPGGGHSDIFGLYDNQEQKPHHVRNNIPKSTIHEVFCDSIDNNTQDNNKTDQESTENTNPENGVNGNENEAPKPVPQTPQRARVPPGGFSSGLW